MKETVKKTAACLVAVILLSSAQPLRAASVSGTGKDNVPTASQAVPSKAQGEGDARMNRIDFGNTYIIGQTIKSGAVYLLQRKKSEINSMLKHRDNYREEILEGFTVEARREGVGEQVMKKTSGRDSQTGKHLVTQD
ncbi:hypothetical protein EG829_11645 [bacterium]|nr:hypothetical protein [bacterium]